jgi:hypothetical protein
MLNSLSQGCNAWKSKKSPAEQAGVILKGSGFYRPLFYVLRHSHTVVLEVDMNQKTSGVI